MNLPSRIKYFAKIKKIKQNCERQKKPSISAFAQLLTASAKKFFLQGKLNIMLTHLPKF